MIFSYDMFIIITEDPVRIFDHQPAPPHSVLKLFVDIFSNDVTASLFYTNDIKVLIDIIVRQLFDISPGVKVTCTVRITVKVIQLADFGSCKKKGKILFKKCYYFAETKTVSRAVS